MVPYAIVQPSTGAVGFDTDQKISYELAVKFHDIGYTFIIRYLPLVGTQNTSDLDKTEVQNIISGKLMLSACQHVRYAGWSPTGSMGQTDGANAGSYAKEIGLLPGMTIFCDLEGINSSVSHDSVKAYCTQWYVSVEQFGYMPGLYVGADSLLTAEELYSLPFTCYFKSMSNVPTVIVRGYCMIQTEVPYRVLGIGIDRDQVQTDNKGGVPIMMGANTAENNNANVVADLTGIQTSINTMATTLQGISTKLSEVITNVS